MTNKQYEHLGRAMEATALLAKAVQSLHELRSKAEAELSSFMPMDEARKVVENIMTDYLPSYRMGDIIKDIVKGEQK